ncbi:MAG: hypothetical protein CMM32_05495 [Rhodospirillaceae bacterium]|nr:hypothetical protein [Rhodospirillaceae bacterium]
MRGRPVSRWKRAIVFWLFVLVAAYAAYVYPVVSISRWLGYSQWASWPVTIALWVLIVVGLWCSFRSSLIKSKLLWVHWMGIGFIFFSVCVVYELFCLFLAIDENQGVLGVITIGVFLSLFSFFNGQQIVVKKNNFTSPKLTRSFRLIQLSDVHIGSRSARYLARVVDRVNALTPDAVVITGDLVDTESVGASDLAALKKVGAPTFLSIGNHERYVGLEALQPLIESLGITILRQSSQVIGEIQLIGIDDAESTDQVAVQLPLIERFSGKYDVLLYHRPLGWSDAFRGGVDLMLSGHTHNGQIFPFNWLVRTQFSRLQGLYSASDGSGQHYVSPGTGTWGPVMRLGSHNEITVFDLGSAGKTA